MMISRKEEAMQGTHGRRARLVAALLVTAGASALAAVVGWHPPPPAALGALPGASASGAPAAPAGPVRTSAAAAMTAFVQSEVLPRVLVLDGVLTTANRQV